MPDLREIEAIMLNGEKYTPGGLGEIPEGLIDPMEIEYGQSGLYGTNTLSNVWPLNMVINLPDIDGQGNYYTGIEKNTNMDSAARSWGKVIFPSHLESIPEEFVRDRNLTSVTFGDHLSTIGEGAFRNNNITHIDWGNSAPRIFTSAFNGNNLKSVTIKPFRVPASTLGTYAFASNELTEVNILEGVTTISDNCFRNNNLTELPNLPSTLTAIGAGAFLGNPFESPNIILPPSVEFVYYDAFGQQGKNIVFENLPRASTIKSLLMPPSGEYAVVSKIESITVINPVDVPERYVNFSLSEHDRFALHYSSKADWPVIRLAPGSTWVEKSDRRSISIQESSTRERDYPVINWSEEEGYLI